MFPPALPGQIAVGISITSRATKISSAMKFCYHVKSMFSRKVILVALLLIAVAAMLPIFIFREPSYRGRYLSEWLRDANSGGKSVASTTNDEDSPTAQAATAIRAIGPKALPHLVRMLSAQDTHLAEIRREIRNEFLPPAKHDPHPYELHRRASVGLQILGSAAAPALPQIVRLLEREPGRTDLWFLLEEIGPTSVAAAPLLERTFPDFAKNPDAAGAWLRSDFHPEWLASDLLMFWGGDHRALLPARLRTKTNLLITRVSCLWALRKDSEYARQLLPTMAAIIADPFEPSLLKIACLHALGRIPEPDPALITAAIQNYETQFAPLPLDSIANGGFSQSHWLSTNQIPPDPKAPSVLYTNWLTWNGVVGRNLSPAWGSALKIELGPRNPPASISQAFRTTPGTVYQIHFAAATGRNTRAQLTVGDIDTIYIPGSADPAKPTPFTFEFRARSALTTLTFTALDHEGYGPFIDRVRVELKNGTRQTSRSTHGNAAQEHRPAADL